MTEPDKAPSDKSARPDRNELPQVRVLAFSDVAQAVEHGLRDFLAAPIFGVFFGGVLATGGIAMLYILTFLNQPWWIIPIAVGFPLIGPFAAIGLYEVSRRLSEKEPLRWKAVLSTVFAHRKSQLPTMGFVVLFIFWVWIYQVRTLVALFAGLDPFTTLAEFWTFLGTTTGLAFLAVGTSVGAFMALALFSATVISIPMLLDEDRDVVTAIITSVKTVFTSPVVMLSWGAIVTVCALASIATGFIALFFVFPILGHTTWHLYRKALGEIERPRRKRFSKREQ